MSNNQMVRLAVSTFGGSQTYWRKRIKSPIWRNVSRQFDEIKQITKKIKYEY